MAQCVADVGEGAFHFGDPCDKVVQRSGGRRVFDFPGKSLKLAGAEGGCARLERMGDSPHASRITSGRARPGFAELVSGLTQKQIDHLHNERVAAQFSQLLQLPVDLCVAWAAELAGRGTILSVRLYRHRKSAVQPAGLTAGAGSGYGGSGHVLRPLLA